MATPMLPTHIEHAMLGTMRVPRFDDVQRAAQAISPHVRRTQLLRSPRLDALAGGAVWLKPESLQVTGSFKARGACNTVLALPPAALAQEPFVVREDGSGTKAMTDQFFQEAGLAPPVVMVSSSNEMIKQAVIAGMGLALISQHTVSLELALGLLATLPVEGFPLMRSWYIVQRRTLPLLPVQARLRGFLIEVGQNVIEDISRDHARIASTGRPAQESIKEPGDAA